MALTIVTKPLLVDRNGITNNDILCVELPTNFRVGINNWNMGVARWINTCTYRLHLAIDDVAE